MGYGVQTEFNRYTNLDGVEWRIIHHLLNSESKYANNIWKILAYDTEDALFQVNLTKSQKVDLIYRDNGLSTSKRMFMAPYIDDAWNEQSSRVDIFVSQILPQNHLISLVNVSVEILVHNKITNIFGEAEEGVNTSNPSELSIEGDLLVPVKSRATMLLKSVLAELNGTFVAGVGRLQCNSEMSSDSKVQQHIWNNHAYIGYDATFCTLMSGDSNSSMVGY